jgi:hypothetical protein
MRGQPYARFSAPWCRAALRHLRRRGQTSAHHWRPGRRRGDLPVMQGSPMAGQVEHRARGAPPPGSAWVPYRPPLTNGSSLARQYPLDGNASRIARALFEGSGKAVSAAAIHPACGCDSVAAGLDEIRRPAPDHPSELEARGPGGLCRPRSDRSCHHLDVRPRSPWQSSGALALAGVPLTPWRDRPRRGSAMAQRVRVSFLATATTTTLNGRRASSASIHAHNRPAVRPGLRHTSARAPWTSWRRK